MYTMQDLLYDARALIDDYNTNGVVNTDTSESDSNCIRYANMGLNEIYPYARYFLTHEITQDPTPEEKSDGIWLEYTLPSNIGEITRIVDISGGYVDDTYTQIEGNDKILITPQYKGTIRIIYTPTPTRLNLKTDTLPIANPKAYQFMVFYVASKLSINELPDSANYFEQKANEMKSYASKALAAKESRIVDVYGVI